jgi:hypothetical protein
VKKITRGENNEGKREVVKVYASNKNNPSKTSPPKNIEEIEMLNFN